MSGIQTGNFSKDCQGKIVFMAPTKPLVAQQIQACYKIMGIPQVRVKQLNILWIEPRVIVTSTDHHAQNDMVEMTGNVAVNKRGDSWLSKRVFFLTPQVNQRNKCNTLTF